MEMILDTGFASVRKRSYFERSRTCSRVAALRGVERPGYDRAADRLLYRVLHGEARNGELVNQLLSQFLGGYPLTALRKLLHAEDGEVVAAGAFIASELGSSGRALFDDVVALLTHPNVSVRFSAVDYLTSNIRVDDQDALGFALALIDDQNPGVRFAVVRLLAVAPSAVLQAVKNNTSPMSPDGIRRKGLALLVDAVEARDGAAISSALNDLDARLRRFAVAAAARLAPYDRGPLVQALESLDADVKKFAKWRVEVPGVRRRHLH